MSKSKLTAEQIEKKKAERREALKGLQPGSYVIDKSGKRTPNLDDPAMLIRKDIKEQKDIPAEKPKDKKTEK